MAPVLSGTLGSAADLVLLDYSLPDSNDLGLLSTMHALHPATPIILMTASLHKPFEMDELSPLVARALAASIH